MLKYSVYSLRRSKIVWLILAEMLVLISKPALAADVTVNTQDARTHRVIKLTGQAWITQGTNSRIAIAPADKLKGGATVTTGESSSLELLLSDHSILKIGANSKIELPDESTNSDQTIVNMDQGVTKAIVQKQIGKKTFSIKTHSATMGVRGTEFVVEVLPTSGSKSGNSASFTEELMVIRGSVEVSDNNGKSVALVEAGMGFIAQTKTAEGSPYRSSVPQRMAPSQITALKGERFLTTPATLSAIQLAPVPSEPVVTPNNGNPPPSLMPKNPPPPLPQNPGSVQIGVPGAPPPVSTINTNPAPISTNPVSTPRPTTTATSTPAASLKTGH